MNGLGEEELELVVASKCTISSLSQSSLLKILVIANPGSGVSHSSRLSLIVFSGTKKNNYYGPSLDSNLGDGEHNFPHFCSPLIAIAGKFFDSAVINFIVAECYCFNSLIQNVAFIIKSREIYFIR